MRQTHDDRVHGLAARRLLRLALALTVFSGFGYLGRGLVIDRAANGMVWTAVAVGALWLASARRPGLALDAGALVAATVLVNVTTGAGLAAALVFAMASLVQVLLFVALVRRLLPDLWGLGGTEPLHRLGELGRLALATTSAGLSGSAVAVAGLHAVGSPPPAQSLALWWGRNTISVLVLSTFFLLAGPPLADAHRRGELRRTLSSAVRLDDRARTVEAILLLVVSLGVYGALFASDHGTPLSFLLLAVSVWAGLRFSPLAVLVHGTAVGTIGLLFTMNGRGPFADVASAYERALLSQLFVATAVLTGLALAFSRVERDSANRRLADARRQADSRARLLGAVLESMSEGIVVVEEGGRIPLSNGASARLMGLDAIPGRVGPVDRPRLFHPDGTPLRDEEMPAILALAGEEVAPHDIHLRTETVPEGRVLEMSARPLPPTRPGEPPLAMVNIRDVTLDRQHRDALASFAGVVAHDLFNPLTIVTGWTEELEEELARGALSPSVGLPMVARVHEAASHMRNVIGDLLAYTVARDQSLRPTAVDLTDELRSLALLRVDGPGQPLITVAPDLRVWADTGLVRQLFDNLLGNAVKYVAPDTRPRVDVRGQRDGDWLEVRVTDNGIGIPAEQRELVFETFHRAHDTGYQGTGLGLAICRRIADRHGGSIHAEAGPGGVGTTMVVRLPATPAAFTAGPTRGGQVATVDAARHRLQRRPAQRRPADEQPV